MIAPACLTPRQGNYFLQQQQKMSVPGAKSFHIDTTADIRSQLKRFMAQV